MSEPIKVEIEPNEKKDCWDKLKIIGVVLITPAVIYLTHQLSNSTQSYSNAIKEQEVAAKYIELSVDILKQDVTKDNEPIRGWAVDIINQYSKVKLNSDAIKQLKGSPLLKEKLDVDIGIYLSPPANKGAQFTRMTYKNHGKNNVTIDKIIIGGGDKSSCKLEFSPKVVLSGKSSYFIDLVNTLKLGECLDVKSLIKNGYSFYGISKGHKLDIGPFSKKIRQYTTINVPFFVTVDYSNSNYKKQSTFGASMHFFK